MPDELDQIETSYLDKLVEIKGAQERLRDLIEKAEARKEKVTAEVFQRVVSDYDTRIADLEQEARPLRDQARTEFEKARSTHARLSSELQKARLDSEELQFRHELGELPEDELEERQKSSSQAVSRSEKAFAAADALRQRFLAVIPEPPPASPAADGPQDSPEAGGEDLEATVYDVPAPRFDGQADTSKSQGTLALPVARLVEKRTDGAEPASYALSSSTTVGRTPDNDIALESSEISRHHAKIVATEDGMVVTDLRSGNGTYVNDERIDEGPLANGDTIRFGSLAFVVQTESAPG